MSLIIFLKRSSFPQLRLRASFGSIQLLIPGLVCVSRQHWHKAMKKFQTQFPKKKPVFSEGTSSPKNEINIVCKYCQSNFFSLMRSARA